MTDEESEILLKSHDADGNGNEIAIVLSCVECVSTETAVTKNIETVSIGLFILFLSHPPPPSFLLLDLCVYHRLLHAGKFSLPLFLIQ